MRASSDSGQYHVTDIDSITCTCSSSVNVNPVNTYFPRANRNTSSIIVIYIKDVLFYFLEYLKFTMLDEFKCMIFLGVKSKSIMVLGILVYAIHKYGIYCAPFELHDAPKGKTFVQRICIRYIL